ncbi:transposase [Pseudomonas koreensis]|nr:transposase [Pseudomonas koreensis]
MVAVLGAEKPHCDYRFANRRADRMKVLLHDGVGIWLAARLLSLSKFHWASQKNCMSGCWPRAKLCSRARRLPRP